MKARLFRRDPRDAREGDGPRNRQPGPSNRPVQPRRDGKSYDRFETNFGGKAGANARRLLALVCRRGGVTSRDVGSIVVSSETSSVEIATWKARGFESQMRQPDSRDPWIRVRRLGSS